MRAEVLIKLKKYDPYSFFMPPSVRVHVDYPAKIAFMAEHTEVKYQGKILDEGPLHIYVSVED